MKTGEPAARIGHRRAPNRRPRLPRDSLPRLFRVGTPARIHSPVWTGPVVGLKTGSGGAGTKTRVQGLETSGSYFGSRRLELDENLSGRVSRLSSDGMESQQRYQKLKRDGYCACPVDMLQLSGSRVVNFRHPEISIHPGSFVFSLWTGYPPGGSVYGRWPVGKRARALRFRRAGKRLPQARRKGAE